MDEIEKQKIKDQKARVRRARSAQCKLKQARQKLEDLGEITDWEGEFITSVDARLEKYDAAFGDPTLGGFGEALSNRQKQVLAQMRRKIKDKSKQNPNTPNQACKGASAKPKWGSSFKSKKAFTPRVRNIEDDFEEEAEDLPAPKQPSLAKKPFLKIIDGGKAS